jgi:hypothetical protein
MNVFDDPCLERLGKAYFGAMKAEIPNLVIVRAARQRLHQYTVWCIRNRLWEKSDIPDRRPSLRVIINDSPVQPNPRRMSSPMKTDKIREFENQVGRVFGIRASAMMEWPAEVSAPALAVESGTSGDEKACHRVATMNS